MSDWHFGVFTTLILLPLFEVWLSSGRLKLLQRGVGEPFFLGLLGGIGIVIASIVRAEWTVWEQVMAFAVGIAVLVLIVKGVRGSLSRETKEDDED